MRSWIRLAPVLFSLTMIGADRPAAFTPKPEVAGALPLVLKDDFESEDLAGWEFTDAKAWRTSVVDGNRVLDQYRESKYEPAVRSPLNIALARKVDVGDFVMDVKVHSTGR